MVNNIYAALSWTERFPIQLFSSPPVKNQFRAIYWERSQLKKLSPLRSASWSATLESRPLKCFASSEAWPGITGQQHSQSVCGTLYISSVTYGPIVKSQQCRNYLHRPLRTWRICKLGSCECTSTDRNFETKLQEVAESFTRPHLPNWKQKHIFLSNWHLMRLTAFWSTKHVCREIGGLSYDLHVFHNHSGEKKCVSPWHIRCPFSD